MAEEGEIWNLDARMLQHTGRREQKHQPHDCVAFLAHRAHGQRLGRKAREERESRDRHCTNDTEDRRPRHGLVEPAQFRRLGRAGAIEHRAHAHEQQALVDDVAEGMRRCAVERERIADPCGAEADGTDHEADLVVQRIG